MKLTIYTDGSYQPSINDKVSGWGYVAFAEDGSIFHSDSGVVKNPTMRQIDGELQAVIEVLNYLDTLENKLELKPTIVYDYEGVGFWADNKWKTNKPETIAYKQFVANKRFGGLKVDFEWVRGHSGVDGNELVDSLAKNAIALAEKGEA